MKTLKQIQYLFVAVLAMAMAACTDNSVEEVFVPVELEGHGVYFAKATKLNYEVEGTEGSIDFKVLRTDTSGDATVKVNTTTETTLFTFPETISFATGAAETTLTVNYANIVRGIKYDFNIYFEEGTDYGNSNLDFTLLYPEEVIEEWEVISENAILTDNLYSMYGLGNLTGEDIPSLKNIVVEKEKNSEKYRFKSPYNNDYWNWMFGPNTNLPADFELPYIVLDGEYFKEKYPDNPASEGAFMIPSVALGLIVASNGSYYFDAEETNFGTIAGNLSVSGVPVGPDNASYPAGKYDKKTKTFDFGATYHWLSDYSFQIIKAGSFLLSLDPALLETNYERDYTWAPLDEAEGYFMSELAGGNWMQAVEQSEEDPTFFKFVSPYVEGYNFYFFYDAETGKVKIPELQKSGLLCMDGENNMIYMDGKGSATEDGILTFELNFYHYDKTSENRFDLATVEETFLWGKTKMDLLKKGLKIEDYEGKYKVEAYDYSTDEFVGTATLTISKLTDTYLIVNGLGLKTNYDDSTILIYDQETGLLMFPPQQLNALYSGAYPVIATLYDNVSYEFTTGETVIGGFMTDGTLQFITTDENSYDWNSMLYLMNAQGKTYLFSGYYTMNVWTPTNGATSTFNGERQNYVELKEPIKVEPIINQWQKAAAPTKEGSNKHFNGASSNNFTR